MDLNPGLGACGIWLLKHNDLWLQLNSVTILRWRQGNCLCPSVWGGLVACWQEEESGLGPTLPGRASVQYICSEEEKALPGVHRPLPNPETWDGERVETESKCGPPPPATMRAASI